MNLCVTCGFSRVFTGQVECETCKAAVKCPTCIKPTQVENGTRFCPRCEPILWRIVAEQGSSMQTHEDIRCERRALELFLGEVEFYVKGWGRAAKLTLYRQRIDREGREWIINRQVTVRSEFRGRSRFGNLKFSEKQP